MPGNPVRIGNPPKLWEQQRRRAPSASNGTCGNIGYQSTLGGNYTNQYAYTNLGQLWQGPKNGGSTQEQYLYCDSAHLHQLSNLSQTASTPTCASKGTVDYTGSYDNWGNTNSQVRDGITRTLKYDGLDHLVRWSSSVNSQQEWNIYDSSGECVLRRTYDGTNTIITVFAFGFEEHAYSGSGSSDTNTSNTYYYNLGGHMLGTWDGTSPGSPTTNFLLTDTGNQVGRRGISDTPIDDPLLGQVQCSEGNCLINARGKLQADQTYDLYIAQIDGKMPCSVCQEDLQIAANTSGATINTHSIDRNVDVGNLTFRPQTHTESSGVIWDEEIPLFDL